jgi:GTP-binding protein
MRIRSAEFVVGSVSESDRPTDGLPEIAFSGRSNVGKSSLINRLVQRKSLARTSSTPGKTQQLNYYRVNDLLYLVDLPGYGYVSGGKQLRGELGKRTEAYLHNNDHLRAIVQLVDARHGPSATDMAMIDWLQANMKTFLLVFTKADKLSRAKLDRMFKELSGQDRLAGLSYTPFSALTGAGRDDVLDWVAAAATDR